MKPLQRISNSLQSAVVIEDLGVRLEPGGEAVVDEPSASSSSDLSSLVRRGAVKVSVARAAPWPLSSPDYRPSRSGRPISPSPAPPSPAPPDLQDEAASLREAVRGLESVVRSLSQALSSVGSAPPSGLALPAPSAPPAPAPTPRRDAPAFIPSRIVPNVDTSSVQVHATESDASRFEDASDALKRMRKKKPAG